MTIQSNTTTAISEQVKIKSATIGEESVNSVDARELHFFLEVKSEFSAWIKRRISEYDFINNSDYLKITNRNYTGIGKAPIEYIISIDMAKEISMVERNEKGKLARKYFIECEKAVKSGLLPSVKMPTATQELKACVEIAEIFGLKGNQALLSANTAVRNLHGIDCMATLGITGLIAEDKRQYFTPSVLGKKIGLSAMKFNKALEAAGMQNSNRDHKDRLLWQVTEAGKEYCELLNTNKKYSDGTPIMQIKWRDDVINVFQVEDA